MGQQNYCQACEGRSGETGSVVPAKVQVGGFKVNLCEIVEKILHTGGTEPLE